MTAQRLPFPFPVATWTGEAVRLIDQTRLPGDLVFRDCRTITELCEAIRVLAVRGAPAIGVAAGYVPTQVLEMVWFASQTRNLTS